LVAALAAGLAGVLAAGFLAGMSILGQQKKKLASVEAMQSVHGGDTSCWANIWCAVLAVGGGSCAVCHGWPNPEVLLSRLNQVSGLYLRGAFQGRQARIELLDLPIGCRV
jgi:hypothetical protein